jgi:hypothetical protein
VPCQFGEPHLALRKNFIHKGTDPPHHGHNHLDHSSDVEELLEFDNALVVDRAYSSYKLLTRLQGKGVRTVARLLQKRHSGLVL